MINCYPKKQYAPKQVECSFAKNCTILSEIFLFNPCPVLMEKFHYKLCILSNGQNLYIQYLPN